MTKYEQLNHRIESLRRKADEASDTYVRSIWLRHVHELERKRADMPIKEAQQEVVF